MTDAQSKPERGAEVVCVSRAVLDQLHGAVSLMQDGSNAKGLSIVEGVLAEIGECESRSPDSLTEDSEIGAEVAEAMERKFGNPVGELEELTTDGSRQPAQLIAEERDALRDALMSMRRSDGRGGYLFCWCDSEYGNKNSHPKTHASYCDKARAAAALTQSKESSDG